MGTELLTIFLQGHTATEGPTGFESRSVWLQEKYLSPYSLYSDLTEAMSFCPTHPEKEKLFLIAPASSFPSSVFVLKSDEVSVLGWVHHRE